MDEQTRLTLGHSFGGVADVYQRSRPSYPAPAVDWLIGAPRRRVLELGAGTGKLTAALVAAGHHVTATDVSESMLGHLATTTGLQPVRCGGEQLPFRTGWFDVVVVAQAFHWMDHAQAVPEIARVLRQGGYLSLVWNIRDPTIPWTRKLNGIIGAEPDGNDLGLPALEISQAQGFGPLESKGFGFWQNLDREGLLGLVASRSYITVLSESERASVLSRVGDLYDSYGRGPDGLRLRYLASCFRAQLLKKPTPSADVEPPGGDGNLLFDFR